PYVGESRIGAAATHCQPISNVLAGRRSAAETRKLFAEGTRHECSRNCADPQARWPGTAASRWGSRRFGRSASAVAIKERYVARHRGESGRHFGGILERIGAFPNERFGRHAA